MTDASVHDSQALGTLLEDRDEGQALYADSAYTGENQEKTIKGKKMANLASPISPKMSNRKCHYYGGAAGYR